MKLQEFKDQAIALLKANQSIHIEHQTNAMKGLELAINLIEGMEEIPKSQVVRNALATLQKGQYYVYPNHMSTEDVESLIWDLIGKEFIIEDFNGVDQDWSERIVIDGKGYGIHGSARSGSLCFKII